MEKKTVQQVIEKAKTIKFTDPVNKKSWDTYRLDFVVDEEYNVDWVVKYTTWINLDNNLKNSYLKDMYVISALVSTNDDMFKKQYLR